LALESTLSSLNGKVTKSDTDHIAGAVTANAGTNLNTSLLALETGGNLATVKTNTDKLDISTSSLRDSITGVGAFAKTLADVVAASGGGLTDSQLRATDVKVSLDGESVSVSNFPATQPVSATSLPLPAGAATEATVGGIPDAIGDKYFWILERMLGLLDTLGTQDQAQRLRIHADIVDLITTVSTISSVTENVSLRGLNGVDTRYIFFDSANAAYGSNILSQLKW
jgi:hypothetical protein